MDNVLKQSPLFASLDENAAAALTASLTEHRVTKGEVLFHEGEPGDHLYLILEGKVKLGHASADGPPERNQELSELRANRIKQWLIENGISAGKIRSAVGRGSSSPKVVEPSPDVAKKMSKEQLEALRSKNRRIEVVVVRDCK